MQYLHRFPYSKRDAERLHWARLGVPSGILPVGLDFIDGILPDGGIRRGKITEIYGESMSGKTSMSLRLAARTIADGGHCIWVDAERCITKDLLTQFQIPADGIHILLPDDLDTTFQMLYTLIASRSVDLIVIDTLSAIPSPHDDDTHFREVRTHVARLMDRIKDTATAALILNQTRTHVGRGDHPTIISATGDISLYSHATIYTDHRHITRLRPLPLQQAPNPISSLHDL